MLTIGDTFPQFNLKAVINNELSTAFVDISNASYDGK